MSQMGDNQAHDRAVVRAADPRLEAYAVMSAWGTPVDWLLPGLLSLAWLTFLVTRKLIPSWSFVVGAVLALLCFPAGVIAGRLELASVDNCTADNLCFSLNQLHWWWNGFLGLLTIAALGMITLVTEAVLAVWRRVRAAGASRVP
jgi:hypothetical protein